MPKKTDTGMKMFVCSDWVTFLACICSLTTRFEIFTQFKPFLGHMLIFFLTQLKNDAILIYLDSLKFEQEENTSFNCFFRDYLSEFIDIKNGSKILVHYTPCALTK